MLDKRITKEIVHRLTGVHIRRYSNMIRRGLAGEKGIRVDECRHYLAIWDGITAKDFEPERLTKVEVTEVNEAFRDENPPEMPE